MIRQFKLKYSILEFTDNGCITIFNDGAVSANWPPDNASFSKIVADCGFQNDAIAYVRHHDLCHEFLSERMFDKPSPVLWAAAHQLYLNETATLFEERWVYHWQRYAMGISCNGIENEWFYWLVVFNDFVGVAPAAYWQDCLRSDA